jgi:hypothetical protein
MDTSRIATVLDHWKGIVKKIVWWERCQPSAPPHLLSIPTRGTNSEHVIGFYDAPPKLWQTHLKTRIVKIRGVIAMIATKNCVHIF